MDFSLFQLSQLPKPYILAHRGNQVACPENTMAAFQRAIAEGAHVLETDLRITADGAFVCIHDDTLDRTTDGTGLVSQMALSEIKNLSASAGRPAFSTMRVPTLSELAGLAQGAIMLALELKSDQFQDPAVCQRLMDELETDGILEKTIILSFSKSHLTAILKVNPRIPTGWIRLFSPSPSPFTPLTGPFWPWLILNPWYSRMAHRRGQLVCPLDPTPDSRLRLYRWMRCDALLTNNPAATIAALKQMHYQTW